MSWIAVDEFQRFEPIKEAADRRHAPLDRRRPRTGIFELRDVLVHVEERYGPDHLS